VNVITLERGPLLDSGNHPEAAITTARLLAGLISPFSEVAQDVAGEE
jgi:hypothetical protein